MTAWLCAVIFFAAAVLISAGAARRCAAIGKETKFTILRLKYRGGNWDPRPTAARRLLWDVIKRTSINARLDPMVVTPSDKSMFRNPFLYMAGDGEFEPFTEAEVLNLRNFLIFGGTLLADDVGGRRGQGFDASFRREMARIFPGKPLEPLPDDHTVFKSFYLINTPVGRTISSAHLEGISHGGRAMVIYSMNDLGGAWAKDNMGNWEYDVVPGGERQREMAFRLGVNIVMYALTVNYKQDKIHFPFIERRR